MWVLCCVQMKRLAAGHWPGHRGPASLHNVTCCSEALHDACLQHCSTAALHHHASPAAAAAERGYRYFYCKTYFERSKYLARKMWPRDILFTTFLPLTRHESRRSCVSFHRDCPVVVVLLLLLFLFPPRNRVQSVITASSSPPPPSHHPQTRSHSWHPPSHPWPGSKEN